MFAKLATALLVVTVAWAGFVRPSDAGGPERTYVVKPADTLWTIATAHYAGDPREAVWELEQRNDLDGEMLRPGQRLVLPAP